MKKVSLLLAATAMAGFAATASAGDERVVGAVIGGVAGGVVGNQVGGQTGAAIGALLGAVAGAEIADRDRRGDARYVTHGHRHQAHYYDSRQPVIVHRYAPPPRPVVIYHDSAPRKPVRYYYVSDRGDRHGQHRGRGHHTHQHAHDRYCRH